MTVNKEPATSEQGVSRSKALTGIFIFILLVLGIFILQNLSIVNIKLLFWSFEIRRVWLVFLFYLAGIISGLILSWLFGRERRDQVRH